RLNDDGVLEYRFLTICGVCSHGAWGAGFLKGWSENGTRPEFRIVTGMSAGAMLAPAAFLGAEYDYVLEDIFTARENKDFYNLTTWSVIRGLFGRGHFADFSPGRELLAEVLSVSLIDRVAEEYTKGRRLYIATANFDDNSWTVWDMGAIAASGRPDRIERFREVIAAAVAVPGAFPPVYFPVTVDGETYGQMHLDAGTHFVFVEDYMAGVDVELFAAGYGHEDIVPVAYVIMNTQSELQFAAPPSGQPLELITRAYQRIGRYASYGALDKLYAAALEDDVPMQIAAIPNNLDIDIDVFEFAQPGMSTLFAEGYQAAVNGYDWYARPSDIPDYREDVIFEDVSLP
ncbi:MAG: patatin-like phospholipase family protein, partial [Geminicoccaceae bacterium]